MVGVSNGRGDSIPLKGRGVKIACRYFLTFHNISFHLVAATRVQPMSRLRQIDRRTHERIDGDSGKTVDHDVKLAREKRL